MTVVKFGILTVSDRSARGEREDGTGPALKAILKNLGHDVQVTAIVPDEVSAITAVLSRWCDEQLADIVLTTGGTGFAPRDVTPEATHLIIQKPAPGIAEAVRAFSMRITPHAMLSRNTAGIRGRTIIINLPGSTKASLEILEFLLPVLPHAVELLHEDPHSEHGHTFK